MDLLFGILPILFEPLLWFGYTLVALFDLAYRIKTDPDAVPAASEQRPALKMMVKSLSWGVVRPVLTLQWAWQGIRGLSDR